MVNLLRADVLILVLLCCGFGVMLETEKRLSSDAILILIFAFGLLLAICYVTLLWDKTI